MRRWWLALPLVLLTATVAGAQSPTGSISGTVQDSSRANTPGVGVTVVNEDTGTERSTVTTDRGTYRLLDLQPGRYRVTAVLDGFTPGIRPGVHVLIGQDVPVDFTLTPAAVAEHVDVTDRAALLDTTTSAAGGIVTREQIAELPLNGRNYLQLATLQPGVVVSRATSREFTGGYGGTQLAIAGARPEHVGYLLDGTNIADISDKAPSSLAGVMLGVDAVQEFSVQTHGYSAEFGRAAGGIVSAVTKSGTNVFRGSVFEFHRNRALNARGFFDTGDLPDFVRHQFGGSLGGPIRKNTVFFFAAYEGLRERRGVTRVARLPNQAAHDGLLPGVDGQWRPVTIHPTTRPYLDLLFPIPDGQDFGDGTAELRHAHRDPVDDDFFAVKVDWNVGANDSVMARVSHDRSDALTSQPHPLFVNTTGTHTTFLSSQYQRIAGARGVNTVRVALNRTGRDDDMVPTVEIPSALNFTEDPHFGSINIIGLSLVGSTASVPIKYRQDLFQLSDTFTWDTGSHVLKLGADWQRYTFSGYSYSRYGGEFRFRNLEEFLTLRRSSSAQADRFTGNMPGTDTKRHITQSYVAFFAQDDWRLASRVSLNLGLRYEFVTTPRERTGQIAGLLRFEDLESGPMGVTPGAPLFDNPSYRSIGPRAGVAWNVAGDSRTVVRGGYGLFYQPLTVSYYRGTIFRIYPFFAGVDIRQPSVFGPGMKDVLAAGPSGAIQRRSEFIVYDARQPRLDHWHAAVEKELPGGLRAEFGYMGSRGHNLPFYGDPNSAPTETLSDGRTRVVPGAGIRYPTWGRIRTRANVARSTAHVLTAGLRKHWSNGVLFQGAYTYGDSKDTWSGGQMGTSDFDNGAGSATNWWDPEAEFGPSNFDVRHSLVVNAVWALPWGGGWHVAGVLNLASGLPFTPFIGFDRAGDGQSDADVIQKPDLARPVTYLKTADAWFDVTAFALPQAGYYGNAGRNSLRGPGLKTVDLTVFKNMTVGRATVQVRFEAFNAFNWTNLGLPDASVLFNTDGTSHAGAGRITTTATAARQMQIGLKVSF